MFHLPRIMGHRGAAADAPENTLAGLRACAEQGASWVEFDVMLSGDGVPVLFHDETLKRTTGRKALMAETPLAELRKLEAGAWFAPAFRGERIPSLEDALALLLELGLSPNVEIKPSKDTDKATALAVMSAMTRCWPSDRAPALISSFSRACLAVARDEAPHLPRGLIMHRPPKDWPEAAARLACSTIHVNGRWLTPKLARHIKDAGYGLAAFTVNDAGRARELIAAGVDCIITDAPGAIAAALD